MLYLEDYLEMIEHLPQEIRDRFTEMRELDLSVHNSMDSLERKTRTFFMLCKRGELQGELAEIEYEKLRNEYYRVLEDADEKVAIATQIHELVERYLRRLDSELFKFKCELEADNNGITEVLEKRSLEMDNSSSAAKALLSSTNMNQKENRFYGGLGIASGHNVHGMLLGGPGMALGGITIPANTTGATKENRYRTLKAEKRRDSTSILYGVPPEKRAHTVSSLTAVTPPIAVVRPITPGLGGVLNTATGAPSAVTYNLQQISGLGTTAIAAAASQAIVATQQMQQGRRTASLKASFEAIHNAGVTPTEFWINRDSATAAASALNQHSSIANSTSVNTSLTEKTKKKKSTSTVTHAAGGSTGSGNTSLNLVSSQSLIETLSVAPNANITSAINGGLNPVTATSPLVGNSISNANRGGVSSTSSSLTTHNVSGTSTALTPGSNITLNENGMVVEQTPESEWSFDPNEPRYCTCNNVSYGDMVACDNDACPYEWFHYPCVGITQPPKGKWYCPKCSTSMRRRGHRKN